MPYERRDEVFDRVLSQFKHDAMNDTDDAILDTATAMLWRIYREVRTGRWQQIVELGLAADCVQVALIAQLEGDPRKPHRVAVNWARREISRRLERERVGWQCDIGQSRAGLKSAKRWQDQDTEVQIDGPDYEAIVVTHCGKLPTKQAQVLALLLQGLSIRRACQCVFGNLGGANRNAVSFHWQKLRQVLQNQPRFRQVFADV